MGSTPKDPQPERTLAARRRAKAIAAVDAMQRQSVRAGKHRMSLKAINREIAAVRKGRAG